jgi:hypothetical protein
MSAKSQKEAQSASKSLQKDRVKTKYPPGRHPNSLKNLEKGKIQPGEVRNPTGRPRKDLAWTNMIGQVGDEVNAETLRSNRETLIRDLYRLALDPKTPVQTRYAISTLLIEREEGKAVQRAEIESRNLSSEIVLLVNRLEEAFSQEELRALAYGAD